MVQSYYIYTSMSEPSSKACGPSKCLAAYSSMVKSFCDNYLELEMPHADSKYSEESQTYWSWVAGTRWRQNLCLWLFLLLSCSALDLMVIQDHFTHIQLSQKRVDWRTWVHHPLPTCRKKKMAQVGLEHYSSEVSNE